MSPLELLSQPRLAAALARMHAASLGSQPIQMHGSIAYRAGGIGNVAQSIPLLARARVTEPGPERAKPTAQATYGDTKVVEGLVTLLVIARIYQVDGSVARIVEKCERYAPNATIRRLT